MKMFLIGEQDKEHEINPIYENAREKMKLTIPYSFIDSVSFRNFVVGGTPHLIYVDDKGIVRAITFDMTTNIVDAFISRKSFNFHDTSLKGREATEKAISNFYDSNKAILVNNNGGNDSAFMFRSLFLPYNPKLGDAAPYMAKSEIDNLERLYKNKNDWPKRITYQPSKIRLLDLLTIAYINRFSFDIHPFDSIYNTHYPHLILEVKDTSLFVCDDNSPKNLFSYSSSLPSSKASDFAFREKMRDDIKSFFGYVVVSENRMMPCWKLVATERAKELLKTKGGTPNSGGKLFLSGFTQTNAPVKLLLYTLWQCTNLYINDNLVDATGIEGNIDITLNPSITGDLRNFEDLQKALKANGLELIKSQQMIKTLVVKDWEPKPFN